MPDRARDQIQIRGLRILGVHGVLPEEQVRAQPFEIDVDLDVDVRAAGASDSLDDTVDYGALSTAIARVVSSEHHQLLERLAERIASVCRSDSRVQAATVTVRKLAPPVDVFIDHVAVRVCR